MTADLRADAFLVTDEDDVVVDVNDSGCRLLARQKADIVGRPLASRDQPEILSEVGRRWPELSASGEIAGPAQIQLVDGGSASVQYVAQRDLPMTGWTMVRLRTSGS